MDRFATSPSQEDVSLLCKTKKKRKKGTVAADELSSPRRGEKVSYACSPSATSFHTQAKNSPQKLGVKGIKNQNPLGMEIKI